MHDKCIKISRDFTNDIIIKRRNYLLNNNDDITGFASHTAESDDRVSQSKKMVFLDILLQANVDGKPLTNDEIAEEVETFMFAVIFTHWLQFKVHSLHRYRNSIAIGL